VSAPSSKAAVGVLDAPYAKFNPEIVTEMLALVAAFALKELVVTGASYENILFLVPTTVETVIVAVSFVPAPAGVAHSIFVAVVQAVSVHGSSLIDTDGVASWKSKLKPRSVRLPTADVG
jgi:hypothetical protein